MPRLPFAFVAAFLGAAFAAQADWRTELGAFRVGMVTGGSAGPVQVEPFRLALTEALAMPVEIVPFRDFPALIDAASRSRVEYGVFSSGAYAAAEALCECLEPLVVPRSGDGGDSYRMVLIAPASTAGAPAAFAGSRIGVVRPEVRGGVMGGVMLAAHELKQAGVDIAQDRESVVSFTTSDAAIAALENGEIGALVGWSSMTGDPAAGYSRGTLARLAALGGDPARYRIAWQSSPIPNRVHALRENLDAEAKTALRSVLSGLFEADPLAYDAVEPVHGGGFFAARKAQFDPLVSMFRDMGMNSDAER